MGWGDESSSRPSCVHVAPRSRTLMLMAMDYANRWERTGFDASYGKLSDQLQTVSAEVGAVAGGINMAQIAERHAAAESEALRAQGDSEQVVHPGLTPDSLYPACDAACLTLCSFHPSVDGLQPSRVSASWVLPKICLPPLSKSLVHSLNEQSFCHTLFKQHDSIKIKINHCTI